MSRPLTPAKAVLLSAIVVGSAALFAQTTGAPTNPAMGASQPSTSIGVTPQAAAEANRQAVPSPSTGTVVRTAPNAVDSVRNATGNPVSPNSGSSSGNSGSGAATNMNPANVGTTDANTNTNAGTPNGGVTQRPPRADRN